jgi:hypothetical protein
MKYVGLVEMLGNRLDFVHKMLKTFDANYCRQENMERLLKTQKIH